ncbi:hypothetical protein Leryth_002539 [Lithospermum erythrorhizon]|nr:hypothetical protein Leryth_002539 [Lithospermum erythrorhizon]
MKSPRNKAMPSSPKKRNSCLGVRVKDGKSCHQCRQKTLEFNVACTNQKGGKTCTIKFCHKCLSNRYGVQAEIVAQLSEWNCPKCREICNCSVCMKKKGYQPTGQLVNTAKASGFSSVSQMLQLNVGEGSGSGAEMVEENVGSLPSEPVETEKVYSTSYEISLENLKIVMEEVNERRGQSPVCVQGRMTRQTVKKAAVLKESDLNVTTVMLEKGKVALKPQSNGDLNNCKVGHKKQNNSKNPRQYEVSSPSTNQVKINSTGKKSMPSSPKKQKTCLGTRVKGSRIYDSNYGKSCHQCCQKTLDFKAACMNQNGGRPCKIMFCHKCLLNRYGEQAEIVAQLSDWSCPKCREICNCSVCMKKKGFKPTGQLVLKAKASGFSSVSQMLQLRVGEGCSGSSFEMVEENVESLPSEPVATEKIPLPHGTELMNVSGIEIPSEDVGNVLQFLEFCAVFGKVINVKKSQAESVVKDILQGRTVRQGKYSSTVQFLIQLLSAIQEDEEGYSSPPSPTYEKNSWIHSLKQCISDSHDVAKLMDLDLLDEEADVYESLSSSKKLKLLNFLCDEILGTSKIRDWIEEQTAKLAEKAKEAKSKVVAAKDKEKGLKRKVQDDIAKVVLANNGAPLSISEYEAIISKIKHKAAKAHAEVLEYQGLLPKGNQTSDAVRIEPIPLDTSDGRSYWRLKCCSDKSDILLQDVGSRDSLALNEKWFAFDEEQKDAIEKHIRLQGKQRLKEYNA